MNCSTSTRFRATTSPQGARVSRREKGGELAARGQQFVGHTPMGRFGVPADLMGPLIWLVSPAPPFVTGNRVPVDGGVSADSGA